MLAAAVILALAGLVLVAAARHWRSALPLLSGAIAVLAAAAAAVVTVTGHDAGDELAGSLAATLGGTALAVIGQVVQRLLDAEPGD